MCESKLKFYGIIFKDIDLIEDVFYSLVVIFTKGWLKLELGGALMNLIEYLLKCFL